MKDLVIVSLCVVAGLLGLMAILYGLPWLLSSLAHNANSAFAYEWSKPHEK